MNIHKNARLTPIGRAKMVERVLSGLTLKAASRAAGVSPRTLCKWVKRFQQEGRAGLQDRSSRPRRLFKPTPQDKVDEVIALRRQYLTGKHIAQKVGLSRATVSRILRRVQLSRAKDLKPSEPVVRYEYGKPGGLIHVDIKKLGKFEKPGHRVTGNRMKQSNPRSTKKGGYGWEYVHVSIDDHSRVSYTDIFQDEKATSAVAHLKAAVAYYQKLGVKVTRVMSDNGACYKSDAFAKACKELGLKHIRTKPYTPKTNGKAERFIQTIIREWAYARAYLTSTHRAAALPKWEHMYNWHRPHGGIKDQTPISRLGLSENNLLAHHI